MAQITIQKGDTLSGIAQRFNTSVDELLRLNPQIKDPNLIFAGSPLNVPSAVPTSGAPSFRDVETITSTSPVAVSSPIILSSDFARKQFEKDRTEIEKRENEIKQIQSRPSMLEEATITKGQTIPTSATTPIDIKTLNTALQSLADRANKILSQIKDLPPDVQSQVDEINKTETEKDLALSKAREAADREDVLGLNDALEEIKKAEEKSRTELENLVKKLETQKEAFVKTFLPTEKEKEIKEKLNKLRTERELLPLELRAEGISAAGIAARQIEDERIRAIQEKNLLLELGLEQEARQAQQKLEEQRLSFLKDDIEAQLKVQEKLEEKKKEVLDEARNQPKTALDTLKAIIEPLEGLAWEDLDAEAQTDLIDTARSVGLSVSLLQNALKVAKQEKIFNRAKVSGTTDKSVIDFYVNQIKSGKIGLENVPANTRDDVAAALAKETIAGALAKETIAGAEKRFLSEEYFRSVLGKSTLKKLAKEAGFTKGGFLGFGVGEEGIQNFLDDLMAKVEEARNAGYTDDQIVEVLKEKFAVSFRPIDLTE